MRIAILAVAALSLTACVTQPAGHGSRSRLVYVSGTKVPCAGTAAGTECLQYREEPKEPWQPVTAPIEGLDWKPGNEYLLKVSEVHAKTASQDGTDVTWHVDKIVEQHAVP